MPKLRIEDTSDIDVLLRPTNIPNPQDAYNEYVEILMLRCNIDKNHINEVRYQHDRQGDVEIIRSKIKAFKPMDKFSELYFKAKFKIEMRPSKSEEYEYVGDLRIDVEGRVRTEYPQKSAIQRSLIWHAFRAFYEKVLYGDVKENYMRKLNKYMRTIRDELKSYFDLLPTIR